MASWRKVSGYAALGLLAVVALAVTFTIGWKPFFGTDMRAVTDRKFEATPARLARRAYLINGVTPCLGCHSDVDWKTPALPPETLGAGHNFADEDLDWATAPNITPDPETGIGA